jgi:glycosyltransferase involved in cell wall biosynthesis
MSNEPRRSPVLIIAGSPQSLINFRGPLLRAMLEQGHSVEAAAPGLSGDDGTKARLGEMGIATHNVPLRRTGLNPLADCRLVLALVRLMRLRRPHVVLAYTMKAVIFGLIAAAIARVPRRYALITGLGYAFTGETTGKRGLVRLIAQSLYRTALKRADLIFFQNSDDLAFFRDLGLLPPDRPTVIVNGSGVDIDHFHPAPFPGGPVRFLLIARLLTAKGVREYAVAAASVAKAYPDVEFHLVGGTDSNPDAIPLREVRRWQDEGILAWHGEVSDVRPFLTDAHVFVLPSYREGTPRSVLEAMAMGRPIITTDAPGCRECVIDGENGLLVPVGSVERLASAMERFVTELELIEQMGKCSRTLAESKYDVRKVNQHMLEAMELT